jgi:hypothetical protein
VHLIQAQRRNPTTIDSKLYDERGDWHRDLDIESNQETFRWICDNGDYCDGTECWSIRINGKRGYLFCEYSLEDGYTWIRFFNRRGK